MSALSTLRSALLRMGRLIQLAAFLCFSTYLIVSLHSPVHWRVNMEFSAFQVLCSALLRMGRLVQLAAFFYLHFQHI